MNTVFTTTCLKIPVSLSTASLEHQKRPSLREPLHPSRDTASDSKPAEAAARDKTIENARSNAADMASAAGVSLERTINIEDYGFPNIRMIEPLGHPATSLGTISVTSYVMVTYATA